VIVQVASGLALPGREGELRSALARAIGGGRAAPGLRYCKLGRRIEGGSTRFVVILEWATSRDLNALGADEDVSAWIEQARACVDVASVEVAWWEALDVDFHAETGEPLYP
jgi:hypothetical protein